MKRQSLAVAFLVLLGSCTSGADATEPREIDIVTVFGDGTGEGGDDNTSVSAPGAATDGPLDLPIVDPNATASTAPAAADGSEADGSEVGSTEEQPTAAVTSTTVPPTTTTQAAPQITLPPEKWVVGLLNQEDSPFGSFEEFRTGVNSAVNWSNGQGHMDGDRTIELVPCRSQDAASAATCAQLLLDAGVDVVLRGVDTFSEFSLPILEASDIPTLGGIAVGPNDAKATNAALSIGGPPAEHAALAAAVVSEGFGSTAILHDDTATGLGLVDEFIVPVLEASGVSYVKVPIPLGTVDATDPVAPAAVSDTDSWIVATSGGLCQPVVVSRSSYGITSAAFYSSACTSEPTLAAVGHLMDNSYFTTELVTPLWFGVVSPDLRDVSSLASVIIAQTDPTVADDPLAVMGYVAGVAIIDQLRRGGPSLANARVQTAPHVLGAGELDCAQSPSYPAICSGDVLLATYNGESLVGPPKIVNGIRGR